MFSRISVVVGVGLVILTTYIYAGMYGAERLFLLETEHQPVLEPHTHEDGDSAGDSSHHEYILSPVFVAPYDMWISEFAFDVEHAPDTVIHHASLLNFDERHQSCPDSLPFSQLYIMAQDTMHNPVMTFPLGTGMFVKKGHHLQLSVMIHNALPPVGPGGTYTDVFATLRLRTARAYPLSSVKEVHPYLAHLDENPCIIKSDQSDAYTFTVPPHTPRYEFSSSQVANDPSVFTFTKPSTIVYVGAHLHGWQGGKELFVEKNGKPFLSFTTERSSTYPYRYDTPYYPTQITVDAGDRLTLRAVYTNPHDVPVRGAMGDLGFYYYER